MEKDLKEVLSSKPLRSCLDVHLENPSSTSGTYTIDPNLGLSLDTVKSYCDFSGVTQVTCVQNSTSFTCFTHMSVSPFSCLAPRRGQSDNSRMLYKTVTRVDINFGE